MKILLTGINAKYIHSNPAIYSLQAYARQYGPELAEYTINQRTEEILADLYRRQPDILAVSCYIWNWNTVRELLWELPKILPETVIFLGGPEVSYNGVQVLEAFPMVTGVMEGEGEESFSALCAHAVTDRVWTGIPGLRLREEAFRPAARLDMDALPFFYEAWADDPELGPFRNRILYYESSRGCPFRCSYCLSSLDKEVRVRSLPLVYRDLQFFLDRRVPQVKFIDRTFNCVHDHAAAVWQYLLEHDNGVTNFHFEIAADLLTEEELELLSRMRPGLIQLEIGVQSVNPDTLRRIRRSADRDRLKRTVGRIRSFRNIHQHLDLIAGLPEEDPDSFRRSFDAVYCMEPDQLQLGFLKVLKGTEMAERAGEYALKTCERPPYEVLSTRWLSYGDILELKQVEEMVELYYNSGQFTRTLPELVRLFGSPYECFRQLGAFYERKGYRVCQPARVRRYEILLEFLKEVQEERQRASSGGGRAAEHGIAAAHAGAEEAVEDAAVYAADPEYALIRELLIFDLYARENMKSRPEFAGEPVPYEVCRKILEQAGYEGKVRDRHVEYFSLPKPCYVIFDYSCRDPLDHNAAYEVIGTEAGELLPNV